MCMCVYVFVCMRDEHTRTHTHTHGQREYGGSLAADSGHFTGWLPGAAWVEKAGTFENADGRLQAFEQAIPTPGLAKAEGQIGLDLMSEWSGSL